MKKIWNEEIYQAFIVDLLSKKDPTYKAFQEKLFKEDIHLIGIRTPILKKMAKEIAKSNYMDFLSYNQHQYYEEKMIHGFLIGYIDASFTSILSHIEMFMPYNDNWAINDLTCANMKCFKENKEEGFLFIQRYVQTGNPWKIRFALVLLLYFYIEERYLPRIFKICEKIVDEEYYVKMANAWLITTCYSKFPKETKHFLEGAQIDNWTYNKTISKISDSLVIKKEDKEYLKSTKRK